VSLTAQFFMLALTVPCLVYFVSFVRSGRLRAKYAMVWLPVIIGMLLVTIVPGLSDDLAGWAGVAYPPTMFLAAAVALLMLVSMHHAWELSRLEERVRRLAEEIAIRDALSRSDSNVDVS
jgi:hypothetical protein